MARDCGKTAYHGEHDYVDEYGGDATCPGRYEVVATYRTWELVLDPEDGSQGWLQPRDNDPYYPIESSRVHEPNWSRHMADKTWVVPGDFNAALADARARWSA